MHSMTGFGNSEAQIEPFGKISVELRSANHKFMEAVFHLPEGFLSLEDKIKKEIETKIKRGRVTCVINITGGKTPCAFINTSLLKNYIEILNKIKRQFEIKDEISINTLVHLPGILSFQESRALSAQVWPRIKTSFAKALGRLEETRKKEGRAIQGFLNSRADLLDGILESIEVRFKKAIKEKIKHFATDEERSNFLKGADIAEEMERLLFHIKNFKHKISKDGPIGKELDFIAQEMQREANTMGAKSVDAVVSVKVIQMKSQIEKIREQVQNVE